MRDRLDFRVLRDQLWYRIPVDSVTNLLRDRWPPRWLAFYQTKVFGAEAYSVRYFGRVVDIRKVLRQEIFPNEPKDEKGSREYYQIILDRLEELPNPIPSRRLRRVSFIPTTLAKLTSAAEINDLFDDSPLEDDLWGKLKEHGIDAERQYLVEIGDRKYFLDFAVYCAAGKLDVETDGDAWHSNPERAAEDNVRDNDLHTAGWTSLRFNSWQVSEEVEKYCVPKVVETINAMGGVAWDSTSGLIPVRNDDGSYQLDLFGHVKEDHDD